jgi:hypothetical protein
MMLAYMVRGPTVASSFIYMHRAGMHGLPPSLSPDRQTHTRTERERQMRTLGAACGPGRPCVGIGGWGRVAVVRSIVVVAVWMCMGANGVYRGRGEHGGGERAVDDRVKVQRAIEQLGTERACVTRHGRQRRSRRRRRRRPQQLYLFRRACSHTHTERGCVCDSDRQTQRERYTRMRRVRAVAG